MKNLIFDVSALVNCWVKAPSCAATAELLDSVLNFNAKQCLKWFCGSVAKFLTLHKSGTSTSLSCLQVTGTSENVSILELLKVFVISIYVRYCGTFELGTP